MKSVFVKLKDNWQSGITVALVSIPLSLALAVASQTNPMIGIITAIWAGLIASFFGGSNYNIIGPTGALSGILATYAVAHGAQSLAMLAITSGIFILIAAFFHLEKYLVFIPASTLHGFTLGIAIIIGFSQLKYALGLAHTTPHHEYFIYNICEALNHFHELSWIAFTAFLLSLISLLMCARYTSIPGPIIVAPLGILIGYFSTCTPGMLSLQTLGNQFGNLVPCLFERPLIFLDSSLIYTGLTVGLIALLETMISAQIADGMTRTHHNKQKELWGLGFANIASGLAGGMPATAALARTALNIRSKASNKISATICSICIALITLICINFFSYLPMAVVAAILVHTAIRMVETSHFEKMYVMDKKNFYVSLLVALFAVLTDPLLGILLGATISLVIFVQQLSRSQYETSIHDEKTIKESVLPSSKNDSLVYSIKGFLAYINGQTHLAYFLHTKHKQENVILNLQDIYFIDFDGIDVLAEIVSLLHSQHKHVLIVINNPLIIRVITKNDTLHSLQQQNLFFSTISNALHF